MALLEGRMTERGGGHNWRLIGLMITWLLGLTAICGFLAGLLHNVSANKAPTALQLTLAAILVVLGIAMLGLAVRHGRKLLARDPLIAPREQRAQRIILAAMLLGGAMGAIMAIPLMLTPSGRHNIGAELISGPVHPAIALAFVLVLAGFLPWLSWQWHRSIDEHEREAYRDGAVVAAYALLIGAPCWWILGRAGLVPAANGTIIFLAFNYIFLAVWLWRKFR